MARSKKVLPPAVRLINEQRRQILDLKRKFRDLRWENRSLKVRLDAEVVYRERYLRLHDSGAGSDRGPSSPGDGPAS